MGKRRKRAKMAKYAKKYASMRSRLNKRGAVSDEPTTLQAKKEEILEAVAAPVSMVAEKTKPAIKQTDKEVAVEPVKAEKESPQPVEIVEDIALETIKTAKVEKTVSKKTATRKRNPSNRVKAGTRVAKSKRTKAKG